MIEDTKRQNFNITPEQDAEIMWLRKTIGAATVKDTILRAVHVVAVLARERERGRQVFLENDDGSRAYLLIPELETVTSHSWLYLVSRPHSWRRQLYLKGRRQSAYSLWMDMLTNTDTPEEAAANWKLPIDAIHEAVKYCERNRELLEMEAEEEKRRLLDEGVAIEPATTHR